LAGNSGNGKSLKGQTSVADVINLSLHQGDDWVVILTVRNQDGTLASINGYMAKASFRSDYAETGSAVVGDFVATVNSPVVNLNLGRSFTALIKSGSYVWDCQLIAGSGAITTIAAGTLIVVPEVTT
jgi:hypothetical protein